MGNVITDHNRPICVYMKSVDKALRLRKSDNNKNKKKSQRTTFVATPSGSKNEEQKCKVCGRRNEEVTGRLVVLRPSMMITRH